MSKGTKLDCLPDDLPLNRKDYKFEDGKMYIRTPSLNEPVFIPFDEILTKKDLVKLIDLVGNFAVAVTAARGDIGSITCDYFTEELKKLRDEMTKA